MCEAPAGVGILSCARLRCVTWRGRTVFDLPYAARDASLFGLGLHRSALFSALYDELAPAGVELRLGMTASRIAGSTIYDTQGMEHGPFDILVVADGARSRLRSSLGPARHDDEYPLGGVLVRGA